jgi:surface antigen
MSRAWLAVVAVLGAAWCAESFADPPAHAPAHGWRKKHDPYYVGYSGVKWERDYDISSGRCNREAVGAVVGGVVGGVIGRNVSERDDRTVATIIGAAVGALVGAKIGRELDEGDRACFGHALEIAAPARRVQWENPALGLRYELTAAEPRSSTRGLCRQFNLVVIAEEGRSKKKGTACQNQTGVWKIVAV